MGFVLTFMRKRRPYKATVRNAHGVDESAPLDLADPSHDVMPVTLGSSNHTLPDDNVERSSGDTYCSSTDEDVNMESVCNLHSNMRLGEIGQYANELDELKSDLTTPAAFRIRSQFLLLL